MNNNYFFEDLHIGQTAVLSKTITEADILLYSAVSQDTNPVHLDEEFAAQTRFAGRIAHGMLSAGLIGAVLGTRLPGPGTIYLRQSLAFRSPVRIGQTVRAVVEITDLNLARKSATLRTRCLVKEDVVIDGEAVVLVPRARLMRIFSDWRDVPPDARGAAVALGNFDGVHLGHASLIRAAHAARPDAPLAVLTFEPHPRELFRPDDPPFRLTLAAERADALAALGVDLLYELRFDHAFSLMMADEFVAGVLHQGVGARHLVSGQDFAFGHRRGGDTGFLAGRAEPLGMGVTLVPPVTDAGGPLSSTRIRRALQDGYPERATGELGRPWTIRGIVSHGDKRGRTIGFPTANVALGRHLEPARGVYAVTTRLADGTMHKGVANIGRRPTVNAGTESRLEVNIFDFSGDIYDTEITVALHDYIRAEVRFSGLDALKAQIAADAAEAVRLLG